LDERHDLVEQPAGRLARVVQAENVGVLKVGGDADLTKEAVGAKGDGKLGAEDLDGDRALDLEVLGPVDRGHTALADLFLKVVTIPERGSERVEQCGHRNAFGGTSGSLILREYNRRPLEGQ